MQIIIPMSGLGSRFINTGYKKPKPLIIVNNKPIIQHVVELFPNEKNIIFICNDFHLKNTNMKKTLNKICSYGKIYEVPVNGRKGPVHAISLIFNKINDNDEVIISYCDYGTDWNYDLFLKDIRKTNADGAIACYKGFHPHMLGNDNYAFLKETHKNSKWMKKIQEKKPFTKNKMNEYASNGTYYFKSGKIMKKYFKKLMNLKIMVKNEYYVSMAYNLLVDDNLNIRIFEINKMLQWGTPHDLENYIKWLNYFKYKNINKNTNNNTNNITTIIPLAGKGSRFVKEGYITPKPLLNIDGLPMIIQATKSLPQSKKHIFICLSKHLKKYQLEKKIKEHYNKCCIVSLNTITKGQACTIEQGIQETNLNLNNPILVSACDNDVCFNNKKYQKLVKNSDIDVIVWSFKNQVCCKRNPEMYGWIDSDENGIIKHISCKKFINCIHNLSKSHVVIGTVFFKKTKYFIDGLNENYKNNVKTNGEFYLDDVINPCIKKGLKVVIFEVDHYVCWGTPNEYKTYNYWLDHFKKKIN